MSKQLAIPLFALALVGAIAGATARAATFYVPNPAFGDGSGRPTTKLEVSEAGLRRVALAFIPTERDGSRINGAPVNVDNDEKPNVFDVSPFIAGTGMLRLEGDGGIEVRTGVLFLVQGSDTLTWAMPVLSAANWYQPGQTAFLQNLSRTGTGHANIEIMNFAPAAAVCKVELLRPKGSPLADPKTVALLPVSHHLVEDPFEGLLSLPSAAGLRAEVSCNQPFYAYGTFVGDDARAFRMLYPLDGPPVAPVGTLLVDRPGTFFTPSQGHSALDIMLPLVPGRSYRRATIAFDVRIGKFTPRFTGLLRMFHTGGARVNKTLYFGSFVGGLRSRTLVDQGSPVIEPALKFGTGWKEGAAHHVMLVYDTEGATVRMLVTRNAALVADVTGGAFNLDLSDRGNPVRLSFGLTGVADNTYFPPIGWKYSNLKVRVTR